VNYYPQLARALLDSGDTAQSVSAFLRTDYGLDRSQAKAAITLARQIKHDAERRDRAERELQATAQLRRSAAAN
jgi:hypothetical protein